MPKIELYGTAICPYTQEVRDWLDFRRSDYIEYDVDEDAAALARMRELTGGQLMVPVLVEDGKATQIGWQGRGCVAGKGP